MFYLEELKDKHSTFITSKMFDNIYEKFQIKLSKTVKMDSHDNLVFFRNGIFNLDSKTFGPKS